MERLPRCPPPAHFCYHSQVCKWRRMRRRGRVSGSWGGVLQAPPLCAGRGRLPRAANPCTFQLHVPPMESFLVYKLTHGKNNLFLNKTLHKLWQWRLARLLPPLGPHHPGDGGQRTEAAGHARIPEPRRSAESQFLAVLPAAAAATQSSAPARKG